MANALVLKFGTLPLRCLFYNTFEAGTVLKREKILAPFLPCSWSFTWFLAKFIMEKVSTEGQQQSEAAGHREGLKEWHRLHGDMKKHVSARQGKDLEKQVGRLPQGEERIYLTIQKRPFFEANRSSKQKKVSQWGYQWVEQSIEK